MIALMIAALLSSQALADAPRDEEVPESSEELGPTTEEAKLSWSLAGGYFGLTLTVAGANFVLRNLPSRIGARVGISVLTLAGVAGITALAGYAGHRGARSGWNADLGATLASAQSFGWLGAALGYAASDLANASSRTRLAATLSTGLGMALAATFLQSLAVRKRGLRPLPSMASSAFAMVGGIVTMLISGIAGSQQLGTNALLGASALGLAGGALAFGLAI